jgi:hypothetical protein
MCEPKRLSLWDKGDACILAPLLAPARAITNGRLDLLVSFSDFNTDLANASLQE